MAEVCLKSLFFVIYATAAQTFHKVILFTTPAIKNDFVQKITTRVKFLSKINIILISTSIFCSVVAHLIYNSHSKHWFWLVDLKLRYYSENHHNLAFEAL